MKNNKLTKNLFIILVGVFFIYGISVVLFQGEIGQNRFTFSDGTEFKEGLFATDPLNQVAESWIEWTITYADGTTENGRTAKNSNSIFIASVATSDDPTTSDSVFIDGCNASDKYLDDGVTLNPDRLSCVPESLTLVKSVDNPSIILKAEFITYTDFSKIGNQICVGTPSTKIIQTVFVNGKQENVAKQTVLYNQIDDRNILKGIGVAITPSFFEGQLLQSTGGMNSGDLISFNLDVSGRFDVVETSGGKCPTNFDARHDGFIEDLHVTYEIVYADPLDLALGTFPDKQTDIDDPVIVDQCINGICGPVVISTPECPTGQAYNVKDRLCEDIPIETVTVSSPQCPEGQFLYQGECFVEEVGCITIFDPVCASDGKTYSNQCVADSFGATKLYDGICINTETHIGNPDLLDPGNENNPSGTDGIVGTCDTEFFDCSDGSTDIDDFVDQIRTDEFNFNSFEFIMLIIIGIIIVAIVLSRVVKK